MTETDTQCLETFPSWLGSLGTDAEHLAELLPLPGMPKGACESIAGGLNYMFKSLDLIPDGIDDIGYLDDAFVLRVAADLASREDLGEVDGEKVSPLSDLATDCELIRNFLGDNYQRLETYVVGLRKGAARGRGVSEILEDEGIRGEFLSDVRGFASSFESPSFAREEKNLIKLRAFFDAKLPR